MSFHIIMCTSVLKIAVAIECYELYEELQSSLKFKRHQPCVYFLRVFPQTDEPMSIFINVLE